MHPSGIPMCLGRLLVEALEVLDLVRVRVDALENGDLVQPASVVILLVEHLVGVVSVVSVVVVIIVSHFSKNDS